MNDWLLLFFSGLIIFISWTCLYWGMRNKFDDLMTLRGRSVSFRESREKAEEIDEFLESVNSGERLEVKCKKAGLGYHHLSSDETATFIQIVHLLGCEIVIRKKEDKDIEHPRVTEEIVRKHVEWLCSAERYLTRKIEEEEGFAQY